MLPTATDDPDVTWFRSCYEQACADLLRFVERCVHAAAWRQLPTTHQEALALTAWDGLTAPQAAAVLGITPTAYRLRLSRARRALRTGLGTKQALSADLAPALNEGTTQ